MIGAFEGKFIVLARLGIIGIGSSYKCAKSDFCLRSGLSHRIFYKGRKIGALRPMNSNEVFTVAWASYIHSAHCGSVLYFQVKKQQYITNIHSFMQGIFKFNSFIDSFTEYFFIPINWDKSGRLPELPKAWVLYRQLAADVVRKGCSTTWGFIASR